MSHFATLCHINIEHEYFLNYGSTPSAALNDNVKDFLTKKYLVNDIFVITPSEKTRACLAGYRMIFKSTARGFLIGIETNGMNQPKITLADSLHLRFGLTLKDKKFANYTVLPRNNGGIFRFSNNSGNTATGNFLSRPVDDYDEARSYEAGDIYLTTSAPNEGLFQAIQDTGPAATPTADHWVEIPPDTYDPSETYAVGNIVLSDYGIYRAIVDSPGADLSNAMEWTLISELANQHITPSDYFVKYGDRINLDISTASISHARVDIYHLDTSELVWQDNFASVNTSLEILPIDVKNLPAGAYRLELRDDLENILSDFNTEFVLDSEAINKNWFAVIDIAIGADNFALLDDVGELTSPTYQLSFLCRSTRWRYIFPRPQTVGVGAEVAAEDSDSQILVTATPRPLTRYGSSAFLQIDSDATPSVSEEVLLPRPKVNRIHYQQSQWFSEIHLSNLRI